MHETDNLFLQSLPSPKTFACLRLWLAEKGATDVSNTRMYTYKDCRAQSNFVVILNDLTQNMFTYSETRFMGFALFEEQISADQFSLKYINYPHLRDYSDLRNSLLLTERFLK
jgi:hypothetical protein